MSPRHERILLAAAFAVLLAGAALGAAGALVARATGTPTTSAAPFIDTDVDRPVNP